jgi:two-component system response regulator FixJ
MDELDGRAIWLVDDDEAIRDSVCVLLECEGARVRSFASGEALLEALGADAGDCLLLDLRMPGMDGFAVMAALRERGTAMPIIVVTGHGDRMLEAQVLEAGARHMLDKPVPDRTLIAAICEAIG